MLLRIIDRMWSIIIERMTHSNIIETKSKSYNRLGNRNSLISLGSMLIRINSRKNRRKYRDWARLTMLDYRKSMYEWMLTIYHILSIYIDSIEWKLISVRNTKGKRTIYSVLNRSANKD